MDFDDLLVEALRLAENSEFQSSRFSYLLVDEFQDISPLQYRLIQAWNKFGRELFVIGDPDPVSYTHLDVYKRQHLQITICLKCSLQACRIT